MTFTDHVTAIRPLRALVLHPDDGSALSLRRALEAWSFSVLSASDGDTGLEILLGEVLALDVLVIAADLPGRDARSFAELIRRAGGERDLSIVVVDASSPQLEAELLAAGVDRVIGPAADPHLVAEAAASAVALRRNAVRRAAPAALEIELEDSPAPTRARSSPLRGMALLAS